MVSKAKIKSHKHQKNKKLVLNSQLQTYQILTNEAEVLKRSCFNFIIAVIMLTKFSSSSRMPIQLMIITRFSKIGLEKYSW